MLLFSYKSTYPSSFFVFGWSQSRNVRCVSCQLFLIKKGCRCDYEQRFGRRILFCRFWFVNATSFCFLNVIFRFIFSCRVSTTDISYFMHTFLEKHVFGFIVLGRRRSIRASSFLTSCLRNATSCVTNQQPTKLLRTYTSVYAC